VTTEQGPSPFIGIVHLNAYDTSALSSVQYTIAPKPGTVSKPVHVEYTREALSARGDLHPDALEVPVFGLYAGYENHVSIELTRQDGSPTEFEVDIPTRVYTDVSGIYGNPDIVTRRAAGSALGYDFIYIKSSLGAPVIIDTDGEIRWTVTGVSNSSASAFVGDEFLIGDQMQPTVHRLRLDGTVTESALPSSVYTDFNHNIDPGKLGGLAEVGASSDGVASIESNIIEMENPNRKPTRISNHWDMAAILSAYMTSQGDDAAAFVRPGVDWFHTNAAVYDPSDDSIIVSSREHFLIKLDYRTGAIKWILGDPTKYWYTFPSLRAKALTLVGGGLYPVGQHAASITPDGLLMIFNDGSGSFNQPPGAPSGEWRTYSAVSAYSIDAASMTARNVWNYDAGQAIYSEVCGSAYEQPDGSLLVDYAVADDATEALVMGLDSGHNVVFDFQYPTSSCDTSWNARPIPFDDLAIKR